MRRDAAFLIAIALAMPLAGASPGVYGTLVKHDEADAAVWLNLQPTNAMLVYHDADADGNLDTPTNEVVFLHLGSSATLIQTGDLILSGSGAGGRVTSSHASHGDAFTTSTETFALEGLLKYRDANGDTVFNAGDGLYIDVDGNNEVSTGDIRLTRVVITGTTYAFGSRVEASHNDVTMSLVASGIVLADMVRMVDATGNGQTSDDPVYLDRDQNKLVGTGDIRWTSYRGHSAGLFPTWSDKDVVLAMSTLSPEVLVHPDGRVLLDLEGDGWSEGDLRLTSVSSSCGLGTLVKSTDTCDVTTTSFETTSWEFRFLDDVGDGLGSDDTIYVHFGAGTTSAVGDLRITEYAHPGHTTRAAGTTIDATSHDDHGKPLTALTLTVSHVDLDGSGGISAGDAIYLDGGVPGVVDMGDVRISTVGSLSTAKFVGLSDEDAELVLKPIAGAGTLAFIERDGGTGFHIADPVLLRTSSAASASMEVLDLRISAGPAGAAGTLLASGNQEVGDAGLQAPPLTFRFRNDDASSTFTTTSLVYASQGTAVSVKDVRVTAVTAGNPSITFAKGSRVASSHGDHGSVTHAFTSSAEVMYQDRDGDGKLSSIDRVYLNVDAGGEAGLLSGDLFLITVADIRLSGTGGTTTQGVGTSSATSAPPAATSTTTTTTTTTTATTTGTTTGTTTTTTTTPPITLQTIASWNLNIQDSLTIERTPEGTLLSWDEQHGPLGFQVFRSDSPFAEITQLGAGATSYLDPEGALDSAYLVTAFYSGGLGFIADANTEDIPGLGVAPEGKTVGGKQAVPGLGVALIVVVLAGLVVARRRIE